MEAPLNKGGIGVFLRSKTPGRLRTLDRARGSEPSLAYQSLAERLDRKLPHSSGYPVEWNVDLLKIACILRCADAAAIDDRRAPARLFAIRQPTGTSRLHWAFQDNLFPSVAEGETLLFKSKRPFKRSQMDEWWLAYDAISIAAEELQAGNDTLTTRNRSPFRVKQIRGAQNPQILKGMLKVDGWEPVDTQVRIPNVASLVERLGGSQLYGDDLFVPIRELVQNSCDAIRARRALAQQFIGRDISFETTPTNKYPGRVLLKLDVARESDADVILTVEDDGIGMPPEAIAPALLDFGTSFWKTEMAARLYLGLQSDPNFRPSGKFGLGFFSTFMLNQQVIVTTRPWNCGEIERRTLAFSHGAKGRAEMRPFNPDTDGRPEPDSTTAVRTLLKLNKLRDRLTKERVRRVLKQRKPQRTNDSEDLDSLFPLLVAYLQQVFCSGCRDKNVMARWRGCSHKSAVLQRLLCKGVGK
jgi:Histidine kinase-, DNA gyrase B-, and HSP90-like ATPase